MTLSYDQTKDLIKQVLATDIADVRNDLSFRLKTMGCREPEFYEGIKVHALGMELTADEWLDLLSKLPTRALRDEQKIMAKLSEAQREKLPPATFG